MIVNRVARRDEIDLILRWAADEGWNPGLEDAEAFFAADPDGFFVAEENGAPVAAVSVVNHSADFAFLGLYLCRPDWRGRGAAFALWQDALTHAGSRTVGLDGVAAQEANYARSGFRRTGATRRFEGRLEAGAAKDMRVADPGDTEALIRLDAAANGVVRPSFLSAWLSRDPTRRTVVLDGPADLGGFATARLCGRGCKVGPVIAPDAVVALALIRAALGEFGSDEAIVDLPDERGDLAAMLTDLGFQETFSTARMYRGPPPQTGPTLMAIATMELG